MARAERGRGQRESSGFIHRQWNLQDALDCGEEFAWRSKGSGINSRVCIKQVIYGLCICTLVC